MSRQVRFYRTSDGSSPVEDFLDSLSGKQARKVAWVLALVEDLDIVPSEYLKKLVDTDDLWEVRAAVGGDVFRLLGFFDDGNFVILVHGFRKKTRRIPGTYLELAGKRKRDYLRRKGDE